jgi:YesN/AraC family two-component response regulator
LWSDWQEKIRELLKKGSADDLMKYVDQAKESMSARSTPEEAIRLVLWAYRTYVYERLEAANDLAEEAELAEASNHLAMESIESVRSWDELMDKFSMAIDANEETLNRKRILHTWLQSVLAFVEEHYAKSIRLEDVASIANLNVNYFSHRFSQDTGMTFLEYLTGVRIRKAKQLIERYRLSAEEVAYRVGYPNANYFVKVFKKVTGMTLSEFKQTREGKN